MKIYKIIHDGNVSYYVNRDYAYDVFYELIKEEGYIEIQVVETEDEFG